MIESTEISVTLTFIEPLLGTVPKNPDVYATYIASKAPAVKDAEEEISTVEDEERTGWAGFHADEKGLFLYDYQVKGFLKEAGNILKDIIGTRALRSKIGNFVFVEPRKIYLGKDQPDGVLERPLRTSTPRGERIALARSDYVALGTTITFDIKILPGPVKEKDILTILEYGKLKGLGQNRNNGYGRFTYTT